MVLVADGFLVPGKADGGVYLVVPPGSDGADGGGDGGRDRIVRLTGTKRGWFYHKAVWLSLPGGRHAVLTSRARKPLFGGGQGELVLLEMPQVPDPLAECSLPWQETTLVEGPDVMFEVVDLEPTDNAIQVFCAEFFSRRLTMHSLCLGDAATGARPRVVQSWVLDVDAGPAYAVTAADLRHGRTDGPPTHLLVTSHECVYDHRPLGHSHHRHARLDLHRHAADSTGCARIDNAAAAGRGTPQAAYGSTATGAGPATGGAGAAVAAVPAELWGGVVAGPGVGDLSLGGLGGGGGGTLLAYEIPQNWRVYPRVYPSPGWRRTVLASGFRVRGLGINPGAPGFPYVFHPHRDMEGKGPPYIALAGDCSQSAYLLRPTGAAAAATTAAAAAAATAAAAAAHATSPENKQGLPPEAAQPAQETQQGAGASAATTTKVATQAAAMAAAVGLGPGPVLGPEGDEADGTQVSVEYELVCAIELDGTVGSLAITHGPVPGQGGRCPPPPSPSLSQVGSVSSSAGPGPGSRPLPPSLPAALDEDGWAKLLVPNYDGDKVYVFSLGGEVRPSLPS